MSKDHKHIRISRKWKRTGLVLSVAALELSAIYGIGHINQTAGSKRDESQDSVSQIHTVPVTPIPSVSVTSVPSDTTAVVSTETAGLTEGADTQPSAASSPDLTPAASVETSAVPSETTAAAAESTAAQTDPAASVSAAVTPTVCEFVRHGNTETKEVAFTFDDQGEDLAKILEVLDAKGIKGTFFLMAGELEKDPELWQTAIANGHIVLNHTVHHYTDLSKRSEDTIRSEILGWEDTAKTVLGEDYVTRMKTDFPYFRSPGGGKSDRLLSILGDLGYTKMVYWTVEDIYFSSHNPDNTPLNDHYVKDASNGGIFLLHPRDWSYVADIIDRLQAEGYTFVTVPELFDQGT